VDVGSDGGRSRLVASGEEEQGDGEARRGEGHVTSLFITRIGGEVFGGQLLAVVLASRAAV
jgi:hypothetical protein